MVSKYVIISYEQCVENSAVQYFHILINDITKFTVANVRPVFLYTKAFVDNSVVICLIMIKLPHCIV